MTVSALRAVRPRRAASPILGVLDAGVSSIGNLLVSVMAAREMGLHAFGLFSAGLFIGLVLVGMWRAMHAEPLVLRYASAPSEDRHRVIGEVLGACLLLSILAAPLVFLVSFGIFIPAGATVEAAFALAVTVTVILPAIVTQDFLRYAAYAHGKPVWALVNTTAWTVLLATLLLWLARAQDGPIPTTSYLLVWGLSATGGVGAGVLGLRLLPRWRGGRRWYSEHRQLIRRLLSDWGLLQVTAEGSSLILATLGGASAAGLLRKVQIPLAPIPVVTNGVSAILQPWFVRLLGRGHTVREAKRVAWWCGLSLAAASCVGGLVVYQLPQEWLMRIVGEDWADARPLVPWVTFYLASGALAACLGLALRAAGYLHQQVKVRQVLLPVTLTLVVVGSLTGGAQGAIIALTVSLVLVVLAWAVLLQLAAKAPARAGA